MDYNKPFVNFMIVGAMKCGTTTLADILKVHKDIAMCSVKEPQFFSESPNWQAELKNYRTLYDDNLENKVVGEASTGYTMYPEFNKHVWRDIHAFNPLMKIIYIMRDPVARIISHYTHNYMRGYTRLSFSEAVTRNPSYINRTRYFTQVKPYIDLFGREQVLLLSFEKFLNDKSTVMREVADFLEVSDNFGNFDRVHSNKARETVNVTANRYLRNRVKNPLIKKLINAAYKKFYNIKAGPPTVTSEMEEVIWRLLEQEVDGIETLMGRRLTEWRTCAKFKYPGVVTNVFN